MDCGDNLFLSSPMSLLDSGHFYRAISHSPPDLDLSRVCRKRNTNRTSSESNIERSFIITAFVSVVVQGREHYRVVEKVQREKQGQTS